jgi:hypothetical protein
MSRRRIGILLLGLIFIVGGFNFVKTGFDYIHGFPVPRLGGVLMMLLGIAFILYAIFTWEDTSFTICPACEEAFVTRKVPDLKCPKCGADLELMEGFYERHPERRDDMGHKEWKRDG